MNTKQRDAVASTPWLDDPDAPPTADELALLAQIGEGLDPDEDALASAIRAAHAPVELSPELNERLIQEATARVQPRRGQLIRVAFGAASTVLAMAAAYTLVVRPSLQMTPGAMAEMARCRSTQELFDEPFPKAGGSSARIERITAARSHDLRENSFSRWGVR